MKRPARAAVRRRVAPPKQRHVFLSSRARRRWCEAAGGPGGARHEPVGASPMMQARLDVGDRGRRHPAPTDRRARGPHAARLHDLGSTSGSAGRSSAARTARRPPACVVFGWAAPRAATTSLWGDRQRCSASRPWAETRRRRRRPQGRVRHMHTFDMMASEEVDEVERDGRVGEDGGKHRWVAARRKRFDATQRRATRRRSPRQPPRCFGSSLTRASASSSRAVPPPRRRSRALGGGRRRGCE